MSPSFLSRLVPSVRFAAGAVDPQGTAGGAHRRLDCGRVAVIDIGSNSVRLVVYDGLCRSPLPLFNEKVLCGLGRGLSATGRLADDTMRAAYETLDRFTTLVKAMQVPDVLVLATAAVRDASNGPDFVAEVERRCGVTIRVLSGTEEAEISALGLLSGIPWAKGLMGDLGGGSLELVEVDGFHSEGGGLGASATLPLGPLRLMDEAKDDPVRGHELVYQYLDTLPWLTRGGPEGRPADELLFYPVGGAWRNLARVAMDLTNYPLHVIQHYHIDLATAAETIRYVETTAKDDLVKIKGVSRRRLATLPWAAIVLKCVLDRIQPSGVVFSAYGLREGILFERLNNEIKARDPLLELAGDIARRESRFSAMGQALLEWTHPLYAGESKSRYRLRAATCLMSDIGWPLHPDYRDADSFERVLLAPLSGVTHEERVFMALAVHGRYGGEAGASITKGVASVLPKEGREEAYRLGRLLRLGYAYSGATPTLLLQTALAQGDGCLQLTMPSSRRALGGGMVERRLESAARSWNLTPKMTFSA